MKMVSFFDAFRVGQHGRRLLRSKHRCFVISCDHLYIHRDNQIRSSSVSPRMQICETTDLTQNLELHIANRDFVKALRYFERLPNRPDSLICQKLVILLSKSKTGSHVQRALKILRNSFRNTEFKADDYTRLAYIYIVDGCLRHNMLKEALELYDEASKCGILLDLQAYSGILEALVQSNMLEEAVDIIREISAGKEVIPTGRLYQPVLVALVKRCDYLVATDLLENARLQNVDLSFDMYQQLLDVAEDQEEVSDAYESFMNYIEEALSEDDTILDALIDDDADSDTDDGNDDEDEFD